MRIRIRSDRIVAGEELRSGYVYCEDGRISAVTEKELPFDIEYDAAGGYLAAGFVDTHVHGGAGADFTECTEEEAMRAVAFHRSHGTTAMLPTTLASDRERTSRALEVLKGAKEHGAREIAGVHIEGPYLAPSMAGAQNAAFLTDPVEEDYFALLEKFGGFIKKWTYAPERDKNARFCRTLTRYGVLPSAGHTAATYADMVGAFSAGMRSITHLYSCTSTITREGGYRRLGATECAYLFDEVTAELIADGRHVPPELIRLVFKLKGAEHIALVTDAISAAGSGEREGTLNGVPYIVEDGVAKLADRSAFAGSVATTDGLVRECVRAGIPLFEAVRAASETPARMLGLNKGKIEVGYDADLVIFDGDIRIKRVFVGGEAFDGAFSSPSGKKITVSEEL